MSLGLQRNLEAIRGTLFCHHDRVVIRFKISATHQSAKRASGTAHSAQLLSKVQLRIKLNNFFLQPLQQKIAAYFTLEKVPPPLNFFPKNHFAGKPDNLNFKVVNISSTD